MREKEGIASDNYSNQLDKEKPKNVTDLNLDTAYKVICIINYGLSVLIRKKPCCWEKFRNYPFFSFL